MADKKTYTVHRAMHGNGKDYARGDTRELTEADAAPLVASGALSEEGTDPLVREPGVRHAFGQNRSAVNDSGYTDASDNGAKPITMPQRKTAPKP